MDKLKHDTHISQRFNEELEGIRNRVLAMGGIVEQMIGDATQALAGGDPRLAGVTVSWAL